jgi:hypothetical protein
MKTQGLALNIQTSNLQPGTCNGKEQRIPRRQITGTVLILSLFALLALVSYAGAQDLSPLTIGDESHRAHILPPPSQMSGLANSPSVPLTFHGGPVMQAPSTYVIFWIPQSGQLQNGSPTSMSSDYTAVQQNLSQLYQGEGIDNNNTQYYSHCVPSSYIYVPGTDFDCNPYLLGTTYYINNTGGQTNGFGGLGMLKGAYTVTSDYPAAGPACGSNPNCITDAQIQAEILSVMNLRGWTGGLNAMFLLFTSSGEGSCIPTSNGPACAYTAYCAYHSYINVGGHAVIYGNLPYGDVNVCQSPGTPSPNNDPAADTAATAASHELTEAITDPLLNAWYDSNGEEIADKCAYNYGTNTWDSGQANQMWYGSFFELQMEYDNHTGSCVQVGP